MGRPHVYRSQILDFVLWLINTKGCRAKKCDNDPNIRALVCVEGKWESIRQKPNDKDFIILTKGLIPLAHAWNQERMSSSPKRPG